MRSRNFSSASSNGVKSFTTPRVIRFSVTDENATDSSDDDEEEEQRRNEFFSRHKTVTVIPPPIPSTTTTAIAARGKWAAEIRDPNKRIRLWLGTFSTAEEAALLYDREAIRLRGPDALTNFGGRKSMEKIKPKPEPAQLEAPVSESTNVSTTHSSYDSGYECHTSPTSVLQFGKR
ncbi:hypothetical protein MKX03_037371 [Papaver bracteatum]|nr:hypothetical protein MKX03_037371 [Papaver bracteatum]